MDSSSLLLSSLSDDESLVRSMRSKYDLKVGWYGEYGNLVDINIVNVHCMKSHNYMYNKTRDMSWDIMYRRVSGYSLSSSIWSAEV